MLNFFYFFIPHNGLLVWIGGRHRLKPTKQAKNPPDQTTKQTKHYSSEPARPPAFRELSQDHSRILLNPAPWEHSPYLGPLTCLWIDLWGEMRGRGSGGEVVVAVGDEGCQRVHVMRVLDNRNLVGLQEREDGLGTEARETVRTRLSLTGGMCSGPFQCNALSSPHNRPREEKIIQEDERPGNPLSGPAQYPSQVQ